MVWIHSVINCNPAKGQTPKINGPVLTWSKGSSGSVTRILLDFFTNYQEKELDSFLTAVTDDPTVC